jgi:hypothetical protein
MRIELPVTEYNLSIKSAESWTDLTVMCFISDIQTTFSSSGARLVTYSAPSITFHWGYLIIIEHEGTQYRYTSRDYALTETYLSA